MSLIKILQLHRLKMQEIGQMEDPTKRTQFFRQTFSLLTAPPIQF